MLHYDVGVQNPTGAGPQTRGVAVGRRESGDALSSCTFKLTNTGVDARRPIRRCTRRTRRRR